MTEREQIGAPDTGAEPNSSHSRRSGGAQRSPGKPSGGTAEAIADHIEMDRSTARSVRASLLEASRSVLGEARANEAWLRRSVVGALISQHAQADGVAGIVVGTNVRLGDANAGIVAARVLEAGNLNAGVFFGSRVRGNVRTVMDGRQAIIAGLLAGLFGGLILALTKVLFGRDRQ
jgi:hypothetical protein